jgi:hypothetical protein
MTAPNYTKSLAALENAAQRQRGLEPSQELLDALKAFAEIAINEPEKASEAVAAMLTSLNSPIGAGYLAVWLGSAVEDGLDPKYTCRPIVDTFLRWSRTVETAPHNDEAGEDEDDDYIDDPEPDEETIAGLKFLGQALVAHLARAPNERKWLAETEDIRREFERIEHLSHGATWVAHLLRQCSGELVVLNVAQKMGVIVHYENLSNCFHLFTLLQGAVANIMPDAQQPSAQMLSIARGEDTGDGNDSAWWHYGQGSCPEPNIVASIWGEMGLDGISRIDGTQVMLLWPPILESRTWDVGFFLPILYASLPRVEVTKILSKAEVDAWWRRLDLSKP